MVAWEAAPREGTGDKNPALPVVVVVVVVVGVLRDATVAAQCLYKSRNLAVPAFIKAGFWPIIHAPLRQLLWL